MQLTQSDKELIREIINILKYAIDNKEWAKNKISSSIVPRIISVFRYLFFISYILILIIWLTSFFTKDILPYLANQKILFLASFAINFLLIIIGAILAWKKNLLKFQ